MSSEAGPSSRTTTARASTKAKENALDEEVELVVRSPLSGQSDSEDEVPAKKNRKRRRRERRQEAQTVLELINTMRYGSEHDSQERMQPQQEKEAKTTRIKQGGFRVHWARFKKRLGTGSTFSDSLPGGGESSTSSQSRKRAMAASQAERTDGAETDENEEVDEIVVDNLHGAGTVSAASAQNETSKREGATHSHAETQDSQRTDTSWDSNAVYAFFRWTLWPLIYHFFNMHFVEEKMERSFKKEMWWTNRTLSIYSSLFFIVSWVFTVGFAARPLALADEIFFYAFAPLLSVPLPFLTIYDIPFKRPLLYQSYISFCVWSWACYSTAFMYICDFYGTRTGFDHCGSRDFITLFFFAIGLPGIALFGLRQTRLSNTFGFVVFIILNLVLIVPEHSAFLRNVLDAIIFHCFVLFVHYKREAIERRNFSLRDQLKAQFRATQKAQINERKASDSKRRLTSYIFHEVRVPLNTALLAVQNMEATGAFRNDVEWTALNGSLSMMSKVLNDVLDFDRLDSGRLTTVKTPYKLHQALRSMLVPLRLAADARGQRLAVNFDRNIDLVARRINVFSAGKRSDPADLANANTAEDGLVIGDEMRLRQIVNNLASNACKFTPSGGQIKLSTRLVYPSVPGSEPPENQETNITLGARTAADDHKEDNVEQPSKTADHERQGDTRGKKVQLEPHTNAENHTPGGRKNSLTIWRRLSSRRRQEKQENDTYDTAEKGTSTQVKFTATPAAPLSRAQLIRHDSVDPGTVDHIVVRIEVHDTGVGIKPRDLIDNKLFSPYVQTEIGKYQGGKGTGLGLALVRRIIKLSGGKLGVKSKAGEGSTFWVELPFGLTQSGKGNEVDDGKTCPPDCARQLALGLEELKFARSIGEGDTPSTMVSDQGHKEKEALSFPAPGLHSDAALANLMNHHGSFDLESQDLSSPGIDLFANPLSPRPVTIRTDSSSSVRPLHIEHSYSGTTVYEGSLGDQRDHRSHTLRTESESAPQAVQKSTRHQTHARTLSSPTAITSARPGENLSILIVDDDPITRLLMSRLLSRLGCTVTVAENGKVALEKILGDNLPPCVLPDSPRTGKRVSVQVHTFEDSHEPQDDVEYRFDCIFLDNQMPLMSGLDTVAALRHLRRRDLVVGVTGNALLTDQQEYLEKGADRVLTKPVLESSLLEMLVIAREHIRALASSDPSRQ